MSLWRPQHHRKLGLSLTVPPAVLAASEAVGRQIVAVDPRLPPIFTLRHLAALTHVDYGYLREVVERTRKDPYRTFSVRKRPDDAEASDRRWICVPDPDLMRVQRWIARRVLSLGRPHQASYAYAPGSRIRDAAELHCGCEWLIKLDVRRFFESVPEISVFHAFRQFGYQPLVSFELTRLCTRLGKSPRTARWSSAMDPHVAIPAYHQAFMGHLPQGAPTSPMLSNLVMRTFDGYVSALAEHAGMYYSRYADDITLSSTDPTFGRTRAAEMIGKVFGVMAAAGLSPNRTKTQVVPPGARKVVLGLLVDRDRPRLSREFRARVRQHVHYLTEVGIGPVAHAARRGFASTNGLRNHVEGLIRFAHGIDADFAEDCRKKLASVRWP